jgi:hypothetical protein
MLIAPAMNLEPSISTNEQTRPSGSVHRRVDRVASIRV